MNIQLIQGQFTAKDALDIITQMTHVKVKYHENKISTTCNEEDIKLREAKIKKLQKELFETSRYLTLNGKPVNIETVVKMEEVT